MPSSFRLPLTGDTVHGIGLTVCVSLCPHHFLLSHLVFHTEIFPSGSKCLAGKVALKEGQSKFQPQNSVLQRARNGKCISSVHTSKLLGRHRTRVILRMQVVWGWVAVSSMIFLNRYFLPIIFGQKRGEKNKKEEQFFLSSKTLSVGFVLIPVRFLSDLHLPMPLRCERCCWHKQRLKLPQLISQTAL